MVLLDGKIPTGLILYKVGIFLNGNMTFITNQTIIKKN